MDKESVTSRASYACFQIAVEKRDLSPSIYEILARVRQRKRKRSALSWIPRPRDLG